MFFLLVSLFHIFYAYLWDSTLISKILKSFCFLRGTLIMLLWNLDRWATNFAENALIQKDSILWNGARDLVLHKMFFLSRLCFAVALLFHYQLLYSWIHCGLHYLGVESSFLYMGRGSVRNSWCWLCCYLSSHSVNAFLGWILFLLFF